MAMGEFGIEEFVEDFIIGMFFNDFRTLKPVMYSGFHLFIFTTWHLAIRNCCQQLRT